MRIGIDARELKEKRAGIGTYVYEIIKELNEKDTQNEYYLYSNKKMHIDFELNSNWHIIERKCRIGTFLVYFKLPKIVNEDNIDVFWGTEHCLPKRNRYTKNIKFILTIHDLAIQKIKGIGSTYNTIIQKIIVKRSCKNADKIIADAQSTKNDITELLNINKEKIEVVYLGITNKEKVSIEEEQAVKILDKYGIRDSNFIFFLSTIEPRKNINTAIKAFELYKEKHNDNLKFIISGAIGWKCKDTLELIKKSKFSSDIIQTGYISKEEKQLFYEKCKAFVYPSLYEGFGLPILEAMQAGALVITSNISSIPEIGQDAVLYINNVKDYEELYKIIYECINMKEEEKNDYIKRGYEITKMFTWEKCAKKTLDEINNVVFK